MDYTLYQIIFFFFIYSFLGWCIEVCFRSVNEGVFVNSGFLNGTYCPIYGFGMVIVIVLLSPIQHSLPALFAGSFVLTTMLEGLTGWVLHRLFRTRWWDYSDMPFNIGGYVCPAFSLMWGLGACFIMKLVHPAIYTAVNGISRSFGIFLLIALTLLFIIDTVVTVATITKFNKDLWLLDNLTTQMREYSDSLAMRLGNTAIEADEKQHEIKLDLLAKADIAKADIMDARINGYYRLFKAFPKMKHDMHNDFLCELRERYFKK